MLLDLALEGRRRVKEQLKKMGSFEYTFFSYPDHKTCGERYGGVLEEGGQDLISPGPRIGLRRASVDNQGKVG